MPKSNPITAGEVILLEWKRSSVLCVDPVPFRVLIANFSSYSQNVKSQHCAVAFKLRRMKILVIATPKFINVIEVFTQTKSFPTKPIIVSYPAVCVKGGWARD